MGKPFKSELSRIGETLEWVEAEDVSLIATFLAETRTAPLLIIGSGGSFTAVEMARLLFEERGGTGISHTPLSFLQCRTDLRAVNVLIFTAGGNNSDVLATFNAAIQREAKSILIVCGSQRSKIEKLALQSKRTRLFSRSFPAGRDGYLATNSLVAFSGLLLRACAYKLPERGIVQRIISTEEETSDQTHNEVTPFYLPIYGSWARPAAIDMESKFSEAGLGAVMPADYRSFAHGRHNWIDKRGVDTTIISLLTPDTEVLARRTINMLPPQSRVIEFATKDPGPAGAIELLLQVFKFTAHIGGLRGIDPGRPGVPDYGSRLYHLGPCLPPRSRGTQILTVAANRKIAARGTVADNVDGERVSRACIKYTRAVQALNFGALVIDFDGTVAEHGLANGRLSEEVIGFVTKLLKARVPIYLATGRGDSIHVILEASFPSDFWERIFVSYYNGALTLPLTESSKFAEGLPHDPNLESLFEKIQRDQYLQSVAPAKLKLGCQITLKIGGAACSKDVFGLVQDIVAMHSHAHLRVVQSSHSIDIIPIERTKTACIDFAQRHLGSDQHVLTIGDRGAMPGNDFDLLTHPQSLSVDEVSSDLTSCWNLLPAGVRNVKGLVCYGSWIKAGKGKFKIVIPKETIK